MSERVAQGVPQPQGPGEDPLAHYTRIFVRFLQLVFASFEKGAYQWSSDMQNTDIVISDQAQIDREVVEKRPAIIVARGPVAAGNIALDQFYQYDFATGRRTFTDLMSCVMTYNVLAREGLEAQRIAWITFMATRRLKRTLMRAGPMHRVGEDGNVGAESPPGAFVAGDPSEVVMVSVSIPFYFQDAWSVEPIDKTLLKELNLALTSEANGLGNNTGLRPPMINGQVLDSEKSIPLTQGLKVASSTPKPRK
jgi:hypothetical protein